MRREERRSISVAAAFLWDTSGDTLQKRKVKEEKKNFEVSQHQQPPRYGHGWQSSRVRKSEESEQTKLSVSGSVEHFL